MRIAPALQQRVNSGFGPFASLRVTSLPRSRFSFPAHPFFFPLCLHTTTPNPTAMIANANHWIA